MRLALRYEKMHRKLFNAKLFQVTAIVLMLGFGLFAGQNTFAQGTRGKLLLSLSII